MTKKALLIGINYVNNPNAKLNGCIDDIVNINQVLINNYEYNKEDIIQLRDDLSDSKAIPTRNNILKELNNLIDQTANLTEIWIHYSGHGSQIRDNNNDEVDKLDEVIVPVDYTVSGFITDDEIFNIVKNTKCKTILLFDSCHSATICDLQWSFEYNNNGGFVKTQNNNKKINNPYVFSISGCKDPQTSTDSFNVSQKKYVGAFTNAFISCLSSNKFNANIIKLYADVCNCLKNTGFSQKPILSCSSMIPSFIFIKNVIPMLSTTPTTLPTPQQNNTNLVYSTELKLPFQSPSQVTTNLFVFPFKTKVPTKKFLSNILKEEYLIENNNKEVTNNNSFMLTKTHKNINKLTMKYILNQIN